ncbi:predicted protein [Uncinocarpus reesii 1704]|uniref:SWR1-complex protein 5 n=1 Tax=Uncinocarpus reesii (strain UAMH 1704) TaxID=336963 RepID=C4JIQ9_UNCRE|nr:uncharacterized protein UREG_02920 [Uncinocarpus reesii 1704]EEP78071.1 predicted protein [Uncinocarpus reesii 1704]
MAPALPADAAPPETNLQTLDDDEQYNSEEDSDFDVNAPAEINDGDESASEAEVDNPPRKRRKLTPSPDGEHDGDEYVLDGALDSGDEATIRKAKEKKERRQRKGKKAADNEIEDDFEAGSEDDEGGGGGGFVRTRAMKMKMQEERKPLAKIDGATVDVDAVWAQMNAPDFGAQATNSKNEEQPTAADADKVMLEGDKRPSPRPGEETITIKRTYKFAGDIITEEKVVPKDSAEAKVYLASIEEAKPKESPMDDDQESEQAPTTDRRPLQRPLRRFSRFDPNPPDMYKRSWVKTAQTSATAGDKQALPGVTPTVTGPKLNTVMKSKLDWAAYVDKAGIKDELDVHSRAKEGYMGRMEFLGRVEANREEERRVARQKG